MIDLHCHIIPQVDDGAQNAAMACEMARHAAASGVHTIVATPHSNLAGARSNFCGRDYEIRLGLFRALLRQQGIPLTILPGAELFACPSNLLHILREHRAVTLNRSRYLLVEFSFHTKGSDISDALELVLRHGLIPVVAHPERYTAAQQDPSLIARWFRMGCIIQVNKGSLLGLLGSNARRVSLELLRAGLIHVIASDAHDPICRSSGFRSLLPLLHDLCPQDYIRLLLSEHPRRIVEDRHIPPP